MLISSGPFKINGVPVRRVNQTYVIATSTKVDISCVKVDKFDDKYFAREKKTRAKKTEGELFETEKEVHIHEESPFDSGSSLCYDTLLILVPNSIFYLLNLQATRNLPDFKKDDQKAIDAELIKAIETVPELKNYLSARFSLRDGDKPHKFLSLGSVLPSLFLNFVPS
jgi:large subunit ribosomal protein L6e